MRTRAVLTAMPADTNAFAFLPGLNTGAHLVNHPGDLVSGNTWVRNAGKQAFFGEDIAVTDSTGLHANPDLSRAGSGSSRSTTSKSAPGSGTWTAFIFAIALPLFFQPVSASNEPLDSVKTAFAPDLRPCVFARIWRSPGKTQNRNKDARRLLLLSLALKRGLCSQGWCLLSASCPEGVSSTTSPGSGAPLHGKRLRDRRWTVWDTLQTKPSFVQRESLASDRWQLYGYDFVIL